MLYIDCYFLLNLALDLLALLAAAKATAAGVNKARFAAAAAGGAFWAAGAAVWPFLDVWPFKIAVFLGMAALAFGTGHGFLRRTGAFFGISLLFGGAAYALGLLTGGALSARWALPAGACVFAFVCLFSRRAGARGELLTIKLTLLGRETTVTALRDTGMSLRDPVTNRPVVVLSEEEFQRLLPPEAAALVDARRPAESLALLGETELNRRCRLLPCRTVSGDGLLLGVKTDRAEFGGRTEEGMIAAVTPAQISKEGSFGALMGVF